MLDKIKNKLENRFAKVWLSILVLVLLVLSARILFFNQRNPGLEEVLAHYQTKPSYDPSLFVAGLLALSLATISAAKGYEIFKRSRSITEAVLPDEELVEEELRQENVELKEQFNKITSDFEEISRAGQMLRENNISLSKECERLKSENEILTLKIKPKRAPARASSKPKTKAGRKKRRSRK